MMATMTQSTALPVPHDNHNTVYIVESDLEHKAQLECLLIHAGIQVFSYDSAEEFELLLDTLSPGVVLLALKLRGQSGLHLQAKLKDRPHLVTVMMSAYGYVEFAVKALKSGAVNFLEKPLSQSGVLASIWSALDTLHESERKRALCLKLNTRLQSLSNKERLVLDKLAAGYEHTTIAERLCLSPNTVDLYRTKIKKKLGIKRMSHLIILMNQLGFVSPSVFELEGIFND